MLQDLIESCTYLLLLCLLNTGLSLLDEQNTSPMFLKPKHTISKRITENLTSVSSVDLVRRQTLSIQEANLFPSAPSLTSEVRLSTEFSFLQRSSAKHHIHNLQDTQSLPALEQLTLTFDFSVEGANRKYCYQYMQKSGISSSACVYGCFSVSQRC